MNYEKMIELAEEASKKAYAPYSKFSVGACVFAGNGKYYTGCNFENSSYGLSICAERNAVGSAIADGEINIRAVAIYSPNMENCTPCGACRQVLAEFHTEEVITKTIEGLKVYKMDELLPETFRL